MNKKNDILESWIMVEHLSEGDINLKDKAILNFNDLQRQDYYSLLADEIQKKGLKKNKHSGVIIYFDIFPFQEVIDFLREEYKLAPTEQEITSGNKFSFALCFDKELHFDEKKTFLTESYYIRKKKRIPKERDFRIFEEEMGCEFEKMFACPESKDYREHFNQVLVSILTKNKISIENCRLQLLKNMESDATNLHSFFIADLEKAKENAANTLKDAAAIADAGQKDYEEASWKVFDAAYKALKNAPADADKATLESLTLALRNAQAALKKAETPAVVLDAPKVKAAKAKVTKTGVVVNVTVETVKDAASYDVYRVVKGKATKVGTTAAGKTTVKDKKAVKGASYYAVAVSKDGKAVSKAGAAVAVKLAKAPKIQKATAGSKNAKLSWKKVKGAKVVVYRSTKKNSGYRKVATTRKNTTSVTNKKGLKAGKTYYYKIATIKGKLISAMSKAKRVKIKK